MVNNFELIKNYLEFQNERSFYFIQILKRKKENPEMNAYSIPIESFYVFSIEQYEKLEKRIIELCNMHNARAYIKMNCLDAQSVMLEQISLITQEIRKGKLNLSGMIDYTRIVMCLYAAIIKNNGKEIQNFDFATSSLKIDDIILAMKEEQDALPFNVIKKKKFDTVDPYGMDAITFILAITLLYKITGENLEGGNENE